MIVGEIIAKFQSDMSGFNAGLKQAEKDAGLFGSKISGVADGIQKSFIAASVVVGGVFVAGVKKAIDYATEYEQQKIGLITLLGDEKKAEEQLTMIRKDALTTPFNMSDLVNYNQMLISTGLEGKVAEKVILNVGDAVSASGKGAPEMERIVTNLQQIKNTGKATEMDMKQFAYSGINMYQLLADSTGLPIAKLKDMDITFEMLDGALSKASAEGGKYHDANLRQSESLAGLKSNLEDTTQQMLITIANETGLYDGAKLIVSKLIEFVTVVGPQVKDFLLELGTRIKEVTDFLVAHKTEVNILIGVLTLFFLPALIAVAIQMGVNLVTAIANTTLNVINFALEGWKAIAMLVVKIVQLGIASAAFLFHTVVTIAQTVAQIALTAATWLFNAALAVLTSPIFLIIAAVVALIAIGVLLYKNWDHVQEVGRIVMAFLAQKWTELKDTLAKVGNSILDAIMWPFNEAKKKIEGVVNWIKDRLDFTQRHSPSVVDIVKNGVGKVNDALGELNWSPSLHAGIPENVTSVGIGAGINGQSITINLDGANISSPMVAESYAEMIGDTIMKRLSRSTRA